MVVSSRGSHIFYTIGSLMAAMVSALCSGRPLPPGRFLLLISVRGWVNPSVIGRLEGIDQLKIPITSSGIEPATFRLVAECLNHLCYRVPHWICVWCPKLDAEMWPEYLRRSSILSLADVRPLCTQYCSYICIMYLKRIIFTPTPPLDRLSTTGMWIRYGSKAYCGVPSG
jgi:hypothetical protein